jgi:hypothetical protein
MVMQEDVSASIYIALCYRGRPTILQGVGWDAVRKGGGGGPSRAAWVLEAYSPPVQPYYLQKGGKGFVKPCVPPPEGSWGAPSTRWKVVA